ncbi:hypothetical protein PRIPAC_76250 [Pristionchus pacificus]|uniref:Uncharacterized protein n=1 Tax=Pristionchus pacificus TaxID=54126 RepID=A0A2A6B4N2_PRIPA|nr:hypothetical protein PRIPAC_76250 [Pristionchus pacificus]|eukprot:PDM60839.1 hypothetical protein PRIPAC_54645 [Pristionchus pacificus]
MEQSWIGEETDIKFEEIVKHQKETYRQFRGDERKGGKRQKKEDRDDVAKGDAYVIDAKHHFQFGTSVRDG